jgi:hypothetical protein
MRDHDFAPAPPRTYLADCSPDERAAMVARADAASSAFNR